MTERQATIINPLGMHARPAAQVVRLASTFQSELHVSCDGQSVNAKSIMGVMTLAAEQGAVVTIRAEGPDAEAAATALSALIGGGFGEA